MNVLEGTLMMEDELDWGGQYRIRDTGEIQSVDGKHVQ